MNIAHQPLNELLSLNGKTALITGAAAGIGQAIARRYAEAGADLLLIDRDDVALQATCNKIEREFNVSVTPAVVDLVDTHAIEDLWSNLAAAPNILVNNAGVFWTKKFDRISVSDYERIMNINTRSVVLMCHEMIKARGDEGGTIVNISSIEGVKATTRDMTLYGASKAAVAAITRGLVKDFAHKGWKINSLLPGGVKTPGSRKMGIAALTHLDFSILETSIGFNMRLPSKSTGDPDDIARMALWLGTPASDYTNGAEIVVDGGFLAV